MQVEARKEHQWLQQLVGDWTFEGRSGEGESAEHWGGTWSVRPLGEVWIVCDGQASMPGDQTARNLMTLGFDPQKAAFVGTFQASMMTNLWVYQGELDAGGKILTLDTEGPSFKGDGQTARYQDVIEIVDRDHWIFSSYVVEADGSRQLFMHSDYRRQA